MKKQKNKLTSKKILTFDKVVLYSLGIFGVQLLVGYINCYQSQFYTSVLNADLTKCAAIILVSKIISSIADPIIGNIIDRSHFKSGKMRPFAAMSIIPFALITTLMFIFIDFKSDFSKYAYITITTVLWNICMSFADIPSQGMLSLLSPSSEEKSDCAGISNMFKTVALVAPNLIVPVICMLTGSAAITKTEYFIASLFMGALAIVLVLVMSKTSKEVVKSEPRQMSLKVMAKELFSNKPLILIFLVNMLGFGRNMAISIGVQASAVLFDEITIGSFTLQGENLPIVLGVGAAITSTISVVLTPLFSKKFGTRRIYLILGAYGSIVSIVYWALFVYGPDWFRSLWGILVGQFVINLMFGPHNYAPLVMLSDCVDYRQMTTGQRNEGIQYSVLTLSFKLANAFSVAVGIFIVGMSGYVGTMVYSQITDHMRAIVMAAYWLVPGICTALSMIPMFLYKLDRKDIKNQIKQFVQGRNGSAE